MQAYGFTVIVIGAISAAAALMALVLAVKEFVRIRPQPILRRDPIAFSFGDAPAAPVFAAASDAEPPAPPSPPRLDVALLSRRAPPHVLIPISLNRGRILELNLPLLISWTGAEDLENVSITVVLPNEITYGGSLERLVEGGCPELPDARAAYASANTHTSIAVSLPRLAAGAEAAFAVPISVKQGEDGTYQVTVAAAAEGFDLVERSYDLELPHVGPEDLSADALGKAPAGAWICRPDEARRVRDLHLPLDRIASTDFAIVEA